MFYMFQAGSPPITRSSKTVHSIGYMPSLLAATASVGELQLAHAITDRLRKFNYAEYLMTHFKDHITVLNFVIN